MTTTTYRCPYPGCRGTVTLEFEGRNLPATLLSPAERATIVGVRTTCGHTDVVGRLREIERDRLRYS